MTLKRLLSWVMLFIFYRISNYKVKIPTMVKASSFDSENLGSASGALKDPSRACGVRARKIRGSESPAVGS